MHFRTYEDITHFFFFCFVLFIFTDSEAPTQQSISNMTVYIDVPKSTVFVTENATEMFIWRIVDCDHDWLVRIVTDTYQLYPNLLPGPIKINDDYYVEETCKNESKIVNLSIIFNENVLNNLKYVECKIFRGSNDVTKYPSRVNFTTISRNGSLSLTFNSEPTTSTTSDSGPRSTTLMETTAGSGCRLSVHFVALVLLSFASSALSWIS